MRRPLICLGLLLIASSLRLDGSEIMFALDSAPCYKGASKASGRFFYVPTAQKPMTLTKNDKYEIREARDGWSKVQLFPPNISQKTAWVESKHLARSRGSGMEKQITQERLDSFDSIEREGKWRPVYAGVKQAGTKLTFLVSDRWNSLSHDRREACFHDLYMLFFQMGGPRNISEKAEDFDIEVRHVESGRVVATWGALLGLRLKD